MKRFGLIFLILILISCGVEDMTQTILDRPINPNTKSGSALADDLSGTGKFQDSLLTNHAGTSRPSYADSTNVGLIWFDTAAFPVVYEKVWNGTLDIVTRKFDFTDGYVTDRIVQWESGRSYAVGDYAIGSDYELYRSLTAANEGNDPVGGGDPTNWRQKTGRVDSAVDIVIIDSGDANSDLTIDSGDANMDLTIDSADANTNLTLDGSAANTNIVNVGSIREQGSVGLELKMVATDIGPWDMDALGTRTVSLTVSPGVINAGRVVHLKAIIRNDNNDAAYPLDYATATGATAGTYYYDAATNSFELERFPARFFDSTDFDDALLNRGYVYIVYYTVP